MAESSPVLTNGIMGRSFRDLVLVYNLHKQETRGFSPSLSHRLDHELSLRGAGRRVVEVDTDDYLAGLQRTERKDRI
jgi:hypothetical protein